MMMALSLDEADKIADNFHPINGIISNFNPEVIFDCDHQLEAVKPIGAQIREKTRLIRNKLELDVQILGDETADGCDVITWGLCL
jgi:hypothetical protein